MKLKNQGLYLSEFEHDNCGAGFICSLNGKKTNTIISQALNILTCLEHRGAVSSDGRTGDGAGILIDIPHEFFSRVCDFELPTPGEYAVGQVFLPKKFNQSSYCQDVFEKELKKCDIMPLLHSSNRAKTFGSGFLYSCMGSEIIMIIPKNL